MASESLGPVDSTESLQVIYDTARKDFVDRYGEPALNSLLWDAGLAGSNDLNAQILTLKYYDEAHCEDLVGDDGKQLQPIISDPTAAYEETKRSYEQTSREFAATYGDMKEAELLSASGLDVGTDYESKEQVLKNYADANPVTSDDETLDTDNAYIPLDGFNLGNLNENLNLKYNDDYIFYDPNVTSDAIRALISSKGEFIEPFESIISYDNDFYDSLEYPYDKFIIDRRASVVLGKISSEIEAEFGVVRNTINNVIGAILAYSGGDSTGLDELLKTKKAPSGGGGGGDFGGGGGGGLPQPSEDSGGSGNAGDNSSSEEDLSDDEEMVIPTASGQTGVVGGSAMSSLLEPSDELLELGDDNSIPSNTLLSDSAADSKFLIPSLSANSKLNGSDGIKKSGIAISGAIVAAASMAVGGKIVYDKKKTDSEMEEGIDNNTINSDSDLNDDEDIKEKDTTDDKKIEDDNEVFGKSTVGFKASLFDESESDIDE